jgi:dUTP pyrophosphatase
VLQELGYGKQLDENTAEHTTTTDDLQNTDCDLQTDEKHLVLPNTLIQQYMPLHSNELQVKCLSIHATPPVRATDGSAGYDLFSAVDTQILPNTRCLIPFDIAITPPHGTYAQIMSRSGLSLKHNIDVRAGMIDRDYTGNLKVILENSGTVPHTIKIGDRIAQIVLINIQTPPVHDTKQLHITARGDHGFSSTGIAGDYQPTDKQITQTESSASAQAQLHKSAHIQKLDAAMIPAKLPKPYDIYFSTDPFDQTVEIDVPIKGDHPTLGILSEFCDYRQRLQVREMALSTPGSQLKSWRTVIRKSYILNFNGLNIQSQQDFEDAINQARQHKMLKAKLIIATDKSYGVHPMEGILQIHFDQLNVIAKHLADITTDGNAVHMTHLPNPDSVTIRTSMTNTPTDHTPSPELNPPEVAQAFTKKQLQKRDDWSEWQQGIYKQLDMYWDQGMFSTPMTLPQNANALHMLWRYNLKTCGTKKCRMVCNGSS